MKHKLFGSKLLQAIKYICHFAMPDKQELNLSKKERRNPLEKWNHNGCSKGRAQLQLAVGGAGPRRCMFCLSNIKLCGMSQMFGLASLPESFRGVWAEVLKCRGRDHEAGWIKQRNLNIKLAKNAWRLWQVWVKVLPALPNYKKPLFLSTC